MVKALSLVVGLSLALAPSVLGSATRAEPLRADFARKAAALVLTETLGGLVYGSAGSAPTRVESCRVRGRRGVCKGSVAGTTLRCTARLRVLLAGNRPASDPKTNVTVWADRIACTRR